MKFSTKIKILYFCFRVYSFAVGCIAASKKKVKNLFHAKPHLAALKHKKVSRKHKARGKTYH